MIPAISTSSVITAEAPLLCLIEVGDKDAMARLYDAHSSVVYSVALSVLRDPSAAEDVLQDVFLGIWRKPSTFLPTRGSLAGWLAVTARNRAIDVLRKRRPTEPLEFLYISSRDDIAADVERHLMTDRAKLVICNLPKVQREALELAFFEGLTYAEIAEAIGSPLGTVKTRIRTALQGLRSSFTLPIPRVLSADRSRFHP